MKNKLLIIICLINNLFAPSILIQNQQQYKRSLNDNVAANNINATYASLLRLNENNQNPKTLKNIFANLYAQYKVQKITAYYLKKFLDNASFQEGKNTIYVDPTVANRLNLDTNTIVSQDRIIFTTIAKAISYISSNNRIILNDQSSWTIYVKQGCYNEDVTIPAGYSINLKGEQLVVLGSGRATSSTKRNLIWNINNSYPEVTLSLENIWVRNNFTLNYSSTQLQTHSLNLLNSRIEGTLSQSETVGTLYTTIKDSRIESAFSLPSAILTLVENLDLGGAAASTCNQYGYIKTSNISIGLTFQTAYSDENFTESIGFFDCNMAGTFTGNTGSQLKLNKVSNYYFNTNSATLVSATKSIVSE